jgi:chemotaxis protein MotB
MKMKKLVYLLALGALMSSCVSSKIHKELQARFENLENEHAATRKENDELKGQLEVATNELNQLSARVEALQADTMQLRDMYNALNEKYTALNKSYEFLLENNNALMASNQLENKKLLAKLNSLQKELQSKEDSLNSEQSRLDFLSKELQKREARVYELESTIARKDSVVNYVRKRVADALLNFDGKGLTVEKRNGKVYVSLENSLLFKSASWEVDSKGKQALEQLAVVLAENPDLAVLVEGHTDSDAYNGKTAVKDNWDLSVMRATSIVKILTSNKGVDSQKITAAGRSEFAPLTSNDTPEGKAANRRTEIIITPDLADLVELLEE